MRHAGSDAASRVARVVLPLPGSPVRIRSRAIPSDTGSPNAGTITWTRVLSGMPQRNILHQAVFVRSGVNSVRAGLSCKALGLPQVTFHALRHTHVSALIAANVDVMQISRRIAHSSAAVTLRIYAHLFKSADTAAADAIEAALRHGRDGDQCVRVPIPTLFARTSVLSA
jgi:Phage integrase family